MQRYGVPIEQKGILVSILLHNIVLSAYRIGMNQVHQRK